MTRRLKMEEKKVKRLAAVLIIAGLIAAPGRLMANEQSEPASVYWKEVERHAREAAKNILLGWSELITEPEKAAKKDESVLKGAGKGLVDSFTTTLGGVWNLLMSFAPNLQVPLPDGGV